MAIDRNPRTFWLDVTNSEANVDAHAEPGEDSVVIEFAGRVPPASRDRIMKAISEGRVVIQEKRLL